MSFYSEYNLVLSLLFLLSFTHTQYILASYMHIFIDIYIYVIYVHLLPCTMVHEKWKTGKVPLF